MAGAYDMDGMDGEMDDHINAMDPYNPLRYRQ